MNENEVPTIKILCAYPYSIYPMDEQFLVNRKIIYVNMDSIARPYRSDSSKIGSMIMNKIKYCVGKYDCAIVDFSKDMIDLLNKYDAKYGMLVPHNNLKNEYIGRCYMRTQSRYAIDELCETWDENHILIECLNNSFKIELDARYGNSWQDIIKCNVLSRDDYPKMSFEDFEKAFETENT